MPRFVYLLLLLLSSTLAYTQSASSIRQAAQAALDSFDTPGFAIGVIKDGVVVLSEGFGTRTLGIDAPVDGNTLFAIASNSKAFISTALADLHKMGKVDLDAPVQQYLPYFQLYDEYVSQHTTVRDLLCHRVGLGTFSGDAIWYKSNKSAEEIIKQIRHLPQAYEWRAGYGYTNLMYITAGEVIRAVTGQSWAEYIQQQFLIPLGMGRTQTGVSKLDQLSNVATPHISHRNNLPIAWAPWESSGAAGGIISSTNDMLRWIEIQLNQGTEDVYTIFSSAAQAQCMRPHNPLGGRLNLTSAGLGWFLYERGGHTVVTHSGGYDGMYSRVLLVPDLDLGIVVLTNSMTGLSSALANYVRDSYLALDTDNWLHNAAERERTNRQQWQDKINAPKEARQLGTSPSVDPAQLIGKYHDPLYGDIIIREEADGMELHFPTAPTLDATLTHWHYDTWALNWKEVHAWFENGTIRFTFDNDQNPTGIEFSVPNDDIFFEELHFKPVEKEE